MPLSMRSKPLYYIVFPCSWPIAKSVSAKPHRLYSVKSEKSTICCPVEATARSHRESSRSRFKALAAEICSVSRGQISSFPSGGLLTRSESNYSF